MNVQKCSNPATAIAWFLLPLIGLILAPYIWKFVIRSYLSTTHLAKQYLYAVVNSDEKQATHLAGFDCEESVFNYAREDAHRFGGAEIRNITVRVENGTGSDAEVEFAWVNFEYRKNSQTVWQPGKISVMTDFEVGIERHLICGG